MGRSATATGVPVPRNDDGTAAPDWIDSMDGTFERPRTDEAHRNSVSKDAMPMYGV